MGLLTVIRKNRRKEKEMRILFLHVVPLCDGGFGRGLDATQTGALITLERPPSSRNSTAKTSQPLVLPWVSISRRLCTASMSSVSVCPSTLQTDAAFQIHLEHMSVVLISCHVENPLTSYRGCGRPAHPPPILAKLL